ncbi:hypothetical protein PgNI_10403, partial [Pyricularia grisea]|uniref:Uncharacterized protein n=1 Tax=Pyricularia grisea TaxID=148305 RepID=A0A6P8AY55_PYRGI
MTRSTLRQTRTHASRKYQKSCSVYWIYWGVFFYFFFIFLPMMLVIDVRNPRLTTVSEQF